MKKNVVENIAKALPYFFSNSTQYLKTYFEENGQELLGKSSGTAGVLIRLFAQPLIDNYFDNLSEKKLENFGFNTYLKASLSQANISLEEIKEKLDDSLSPNLVFEILNKSINEEIISFDPKDIVLIFQPKYHPVVVFVKKSFQNILKELKTNTADIRVFLKHFNENIETTLVKEFGDDYEKHLKETELYRLKDNETTFLWDMIQLGKIGFKETEDLKYEKTFAKWRKCSDLREPEIENSRGKSKNEDKEDESENEDIYPIEELIEQYFDRDPNNHLGEILFVIADFGKGKSVFLRHYASNLAKQYLQTGDGYFPVYFNLRNFKNFSSEPKLGVISDFLESKYSIKIDDEYFQNKRYIFLVDSLDESGDLKKQAIDRVINSVRDIQGIDKAKYKTNRIIITSRPFDDGLGSHLNGHNPFIIKNDENRDIPYFINVFGFTKAQFNDWLFDTLKSYPDLNEILTTGYAQKIIDCIKNDEKIDIYTELLEHNTLSQSELRRPIFAYMIYQLIINNIDFLALGKIGVYLSFLNLLTKEAKHIHDVNYTVNLKEEFEFRNILQATASLWVYERQQGKQGALNKADICRVLEGKNRSESDNEVLESYKGKGFIEIQFLSHSYFGENDNVLHFQHQSFAEILLAEYYLKVFIKYALDEGADPEEARAKLTLGEPTEQTILFFKEMLNLLRDTASELDSTEIIEKRKLLFPLMASLATEKHNRLFCYDISYSWFKHCNIKENQSEYPIESLQQWCINRKKLDRICNLAAVILNSKNNYLLSKANTKTALFYDDLLFLQNQNISNLPPNIDRWLSLVIGNSLYNDFSNPQEPKLFNWDYKINFFHLFDMIKSWNYSINDSSPNWAKSFFIGIDMRSNDSDIDLNHYNFDGINFSFSYLKKINSWGGNWSRCYLDSCTFENISFISSLFMMASIQNIKEIIQPLDMHNCQASTAVKLLDALRTSNLYTLNEEEVYKEMKYSAFVSDFSIHPPYDVFKTVSGFMIYGLKNSLFTIDIIKTWFKFDNEDTEKVFIKKINSLKKYEPKKKIRNRNSPVSKPKSL